MSIFDAFSRFAIETTRHYMRKILTPDVPPVGQLALYFKADGILYQLDEDGIETPVGSSILHDPVTVPHGGTSVDTFGPQASGAIIHTPGPLGQEALYAGPLLNADLSGDYEFPGSVKVDGGLNATITNLGPQLQAIFPVTSKQPLSDHLINSAVPVVIDATDWTITGDTTNGSAICFFVSAVCADPGSASSNANLFSRLDGGPWESIGDATTVGAGTVTISGFKLNSPVVAGVHLIEIGLSTNGQINVSNNSSGLLLFLQNL